MAFHKVFIGVGSNIGAGRLNCSKAADALKGKSDVSFIVQSKFYKTRPLYYKNQDWFVNAVFKINTSLEPFKLLSLLKSIQKEAGRYTDKIRFGPRIIDLDILLYDDLVLDTDELIIPHPRMHERRFVLKPICDIAPDTIHPVLNLSMRQLFNKIDVCSQEVIRL